MIAMAAPSAKPTMGPKLTELESRVAARKRELVVEILEHKKSLRIGAVDESRRLQDRLSHLSMLLKERVTDGWNNIDDTTRRELDLWIAR